MNVPSPSEFQNTFYDAVWLQIAAAICQRHQIAYSRLERAKQGENIVVFVDEKYILKVYVPHKRGFTRECDALRFIRNKTSLVVPEIVAAGDFEGFNYLITNLLPGRPLTRSEWLGVDRSYQIAVLRHLAIGLKQMHSVDSQPITFDWDHFISNQLATVMDRQRKEGGNPEWLRSLPGYLERYLPLIADKSAASFMHGDVHFGNLRFAENADGSPAIGLFDFADSLRGFHEYEYVAIVVLMIQGQGDLQREFFRFYGYRDHEMDEEMRRRLMLLTILYEHSSLSRYAQRLGGGSERLTLEELERSIWNFV
jgi:hygromycin-B 7''-O-kinase